MVEIRVTPGSEGIEGLSTETLDTIKQSDIRRRHY